MRVCVNETRSLELSKACVLWCVHTVNMWILGATDRSSALGSQVMCVQDIKSESGKVVAPGVRWSR
jgi:hypothetical protein